MRTNSRRQQLARMFAGLALMALPVLGGAAHAVEVTNIEVSGASDQTVVNVRLSDGAER